MVQLLDPVDSDELNNTKACLVFEIDLPCRDHDISEGPLHVHCRVGWVRGSEED